MIIDEKEGNDYIGNLINSNKEFSVSRMGLGEIKTIYSNCIEKIKRPNEIELAKQNGGVYGDSFDYFILEYSNSIKESTVHCYWKTDDMQINKFQKIIFDNFTPDSIKIPHRSIEPYFFENPWTKELKGLKVLIISPFSNTIRYQYKKKDMIWKDRNFMPDFNIITYQSVQSLGNIGPHTSWLESLNVMKKEISEIDFDIALLGCGTYGLPLTTYIYKTLKKKAIYVGGALQLFFGIRGRRWDNHPDFQVFFNENWRRPFDDEKPIKYNQIEGGCYW